MYCNNCGHRNDNQAGFCASCSTELRLIIDEHTIQASPINNAAMQYSGLWKRLAAAIIDGAILYFGAMALYILLLLILGTIAGIIDLDEGAGWVIISIGAIIILISGIAYFTLMESSSKQATLGKMALNIIVTDREGNRISFWRSAFRFFIKFIASATYGILLLVSCFTIALTKEKKALHDMIAGTRVMIKM